MISKYVNAVVRNITPPIVLTLGKKMLPRTTVSPLPVEKDEYVDWICWVVGGFLSGARGNICAFEHAIKNMPEKGAIVEIGSFLGMSTNILTYLAWKHRRSNPFFCCDPWLFENTEKPIADYFDASTNEFRNYAMKTFMMNAEAFSGDRKPFAIESLSVQFLEQWNAKDTAKDVFGRVARLGGPISFAYIDGDHTYEGARSDFLGVDRHLQRGGFMLFDDSSDDSRFECKKVVLEVCDNSDYELISKTPNYFFRKK